MIQLNLIRSIKNLLDVLQDELDTSSTTSPTARFPATSAFSPASPPARTQWLTDDHRRIRMRLSPLLSIEQTLTRKLLPNDAAAPTSYAYELDAKDKEGRRSIQELRVRAGSGWKSLLSRAVGHALEEPPRGGGRPPTAREDEARKDDPTMALAASRDDIVSLWADPVVQRVLNKSGVRLQDLPGL